MTTLFQAQKIARAEGGIYRVEALLTAPGQAAILWNERGEENYGAVAWQGPVEDAGAEVRRASAATRALRTVVPDMPSY